MSTSADHSRLVHAVLAELGALPDVVIGANPCGRARYMTEKGAEFVVPYGWLSPGGPDVLAAVGPHGRLVALEVKTGKATCSKEQKACHEALRAAGVEVVVVRQVADAREAIGRMRGSRL